jgi:hypothetical protein
MGAPSPDSADAPVTIGTLRRRGERDGRVAVALSGVDDDVTLPADGALLVDVVG